MPISFNNNFSNVISKTVHAVVNPDRSWGTLIEEIPSDIGRTYQSYKRGGFLEGIERFTKETLSACVWMFGIPIFNSLGNLFFEKVLKVPVDMDYAPETIKNVANYLKTGANPDKLDVSELKKYASFDFKKYSAEDLAKKIKKCKGVSIVGAVILNCLMMGIVIPKFNQMLTRKRLEKMNSQKQDDTPVLNTSFDEFKKKTSKKELSFTGLGSNIVNFFKNYPYYAENNNTVRLMSTDVATLCGRVATSRNKYEALENAVVDVGSIYFYNFCARNLRDFLCSKAKVPIINPMVYKTFLEADENVIKSAMDRVGENKKTVSEIFDKNLANKIYDFSTFGKYTKLNRFVSKKDKKAIDNQIYNYIKTLSSKIDYKNDKKLDIDKFRQLTKSYNLKSAAFLALGFGVAIYGLSTFLPKLAFKITTLLTGKNEFTGIANFNEDNNVKKS